MSEQDFGGSWWGKRWIESLERLSTAWQNRLPRGRDYASKGHVISISVGTGKITARVQGSRSKPYNTTIELPTFKEDDWVKLATSMANEARLAAELLNGEMPEGIEQHLQTLNVSLFPARNSELLSNCTCPDKARPCKHIAAVHYAFGKALDRDPFLLFALRGADRERLLNLLHRAWFGDGAESEVDESLLAQVREERGQLVQPMSADRFNRSPDARGDITVYIRPPEDNLLLLRRLGNPTSWELPIPITDLLGPVIEASATMAMNFALTSTDDSEFDDADFDDADFDDPDFDIESDLREDEADARKDRRDEPEEEQESPYATLFQALKAAPAISGSPAAPTALPSMLPGADILSGAIGVDQRAAERNQAAVVGRRKRGAAAETPPSSPTVPTAAPVLIRRRAGAQADDKPQPTVLKLKAPAATETPVEPVATAPAPRPAPAPVVTRRAAASGAADATVVTRRRVVTPTQDAPSEPPPGLTTRPGRAEKAPAPAPVAAEPVTRRKRTVEASEPVTRARPLMICDGEARTAWEQDNPRLALDTSVEAWNIEPAEHRLLLIAAAAERLDGVSATLRPLAATVAENARRIGRQVSTPQLILLLAAGSYDEATEFMLAMEADIWRGDDPPGQVYLPFLLMALAQEHTVPDRSCLAQLWDDLFSRGERTFSDMDDPPAPVGAWLEWTLQDIPVPEDQHPMLIQVARNLGIHLLETARSRPLALKPAVIARLAVAVAEALRLVADEDDADDYTALANARAAADPPLARALSAAIADSALMGYRA